MKFLFVIKTPLQFNMYKTWMVFKWTNLFEQYIIYNTLKMTWSLDLFIDKFFLNIKSFEKKFTVVFLHSRNFLRPRNPLRVEEDVLLQLLPFPQLLEFPASVRLFSLLWKLSAIKSFSLGLSPFRKF